jgi:hypothetical protein
MQMKKIPLCLVLAPFSKRLQPLLFTACPAARQDKMKQDAHCVALVTRKSAGHPKT